MRELKLVSFSTLFIMIMVVSPLGNSSVMIDQQTCGSENLVLMIDLMSPNTNPQRNVMAALMPSEFPRACIGVDDHISTDWTTIASKTWGYGSSPIPTFDNGGFDTLFMKYSTAGAPAVTLDDLYTTSQFPENGGHNFIQYSNATFDALHDQYVMTLNSTKRDALAHKMQQILYEDQPTLTIFYEHSFWLYKQALATSITPEVATGLIPASFSDTWKDVGAGSGITDLVYAHPYDLVEFVPQVLNSYSDDPTVANRYQSAIWQGLYTRNLNTHEFLPLLAATMPVWDETNTVANVTIQTDIPFADGQLMDMTDVIESFKRILTPEAGDNLYTHYTYYFGTPEERGGWDNIIKQIDADTVQFNLTQPYFQALDLFSFPILPTHVWGTHDVPTASGYDFNGVLQSQADHGALDGYGFGTGPFRYSQINNIDGIVELQSNANYWNGTPALDFISFEKHTTSAALSAFDSGNVHIIDIEMGVTPTTVSSLTSTDYDSQFVNDYSWQEISINMYHPIIGTGAQTPLGLQDPSRAQEAARYVRQAMSHAIPRQTIIDEIYDGFGSPGITAWAEGTQNFNDQLTPYVYNIQRAKELLAKAGYDIYVEPIDPSDPTDEPTNPTTNDPGDTNRTTSPEFELGPSFALTFGLMVTPMIMMYFTRRKQSS